MKMKIKMLVLLSTILLSGCATADKSMYRAYEEVVKSNNEVEKEKLKQEGMTAREAINPGAGKVEELVQKNEKTKELKERIEKLKEKYLVVLMQNLQNQDKENRFQNTFFQKYSNDGFSVMAISNGPPCSVICADGCTEECIEKCDICDESNPVLNENNSSEINDDSKNDFPSENESTDKILKELEKELKKELEDAESELSNYDQKNDQKENPRAEVQQPAIQIIGATGNITLNLGAGAKTSSGQTEQKKENVVLPRSTSQIAVEKGMNIAGDALKFGTWLGFAGIAGNALESIVETPTEDNTGRTEVFDSRDQSVSGSYNAGME